jgi:hypothetical protein
MTPAAAPGLADPRRPVPVRPPGAARIPARFAGARPARRSGRRPLQPQLHARLHLFRRLGRRCAPGGAGRPRRARTRRRRPDAHPLPARAARAAALERPLEGPGAALQVQARCLVNAAGPWAARLPASARRAPARAAAPGQGQPHRGAAPVRARGRLPASAARRAHRVRAALRGRVHPGRHHRRRLPGELDHVAISAVETAYLCEPSTAAFQRQHRSGDVVWSYAGVRPLIGQEGPAPAPRTPAATTVSNSTKRRAAAVRLRRQDHHLPQAGRAGGRLDRPALGRPRARLDRTGLPARRRSVRQGPSGARRARIRRLAAHAPAAVFLAAAGAAGCAMRAPTARGWDTPCWRIAARGRTWATRSCRGCSRWRRTTW